MTSETNMPVLSAARMSRYVIRPINLFFNIDNRNVPNPVSFHELFRPARVALASSGKRSVVIISRILNMLSVSLIDQSISGLFNI